ncbi:MAG: FHA domain-containing protein [Planctomycetota bacterium]
MPPNQAEEAKTESERAAYLLTPTGDKFSLEPGKSYVLGRARESDIVVSDVASSRHHARVTVGRGPGAIEVEDLESRNGTFVNDERIWGSVPLRHGCNLRIGATVYRVVVQTGEEEEELAPPQDTATMALEKLSGGHEVGEELVRVLQDRDGTGSKIAGQLSSFGLVEVLQILNRSNRSGTLHLAVAPGHGTIEIRNGEIHCVSVAELEGFHALVLLARQKEGKFWLAKSTGRCIRSVREPTARLLIELVQHL